MNYRYCRLPTPRSYDAVRQTHKLSKTLSALSRHLHQKKFDGSEPTMIFDFLDRYREPARDSRFPRKRHSSS